MNDGSIKNLPPTLTPVQRKSNADVSTTGLKTLTPIVEKKIDSVTAPNRMINNEPSRGLINESLLTTSKTFNNLAKNDLNVKLVYSTSKTQKTSTQDKNRLKLSIDNPEIITNDQQEGFELLGSGQEVIATRDKCIVVKTDKNVYVNVNENIVEQNYIKNSGESSTLLVGVVDTNNSYTSVICNVQQLAFDINSGFTVCSLGVGVAKLAVNLDNTVTTDKIVNGAVTTPKLANNAVTTTKLRDGNVTTAKIADDAITAEKLADSSVDLATGTVTGILPVDKGGTGIASATLNGIVYGQGPNNSLAVSSAGVWDSVNQVGQILSVNSSNVPTWTNNLDGGTF